MAGNKLIVSNLGALNSKYGGAGVADVQHAVDVMIAADNNAGISTRVLYLDDTGVMGALGAPPVTASHSDQQNKDAIDAVLKSKQTVTLFPAGNGSVDYLLLLGSVDIIPQQRLFNPVDDSDGDTIASDLPYACDSPYSKDVSAFLKPSRLVGRLPDLTGSPDKFYFVDVLTRAAARPERPIADFRNYFAVTSADTRTATEESLQTLFGGSTLQVCPPEGCPGIDICLKTCSRPPCPPGGLGWSEAQMAACTHYFNFHGISRSVTALGTGPTGATIAMHAGSVTSLTDGMIAVHAGCYGAELYDPRFALDPYRLPGLCNRYLQRGCAAYFGSSTSTYGRPQSHNDNSDLITLLFLQQLFKGSSSGQACLSARKGFIAASQMSPKALKTVAQFSLMGDPSLTPVQAFLRPPKPLPTPPGNFHMQDLGRLKAIPEE